MNVGSKSTKRKIPVWKNLSTKIKIIVTIIIIHLNSIPSFCCPTKRYSTSFTSIPLILLWGFGGIKAVLLALLAKGAQALARALVRELIWAFKLALPRHLVRALARAIPIYAASTPFTSDQGCSPATRQVT